MTIFEKIKRISDKPWFYPVALLFIGFVSYGYVLTSLGYYWADWEIMFFTKLDPSLQFGFYAVDRPFPWTYQLIYFLVGSKPLGWHIVTLLIRWAGTMFFVNSLILLWPRYKKHFLWLGALLIVYPGFLQQTQSATKARHIMTFLLFTLSLYMMALAIKHPRRSHILFPLSWIATISHLFTTEYFSGLELIRPILLWILIEGDNNDSKKKTQTLRQVVINYIPYLLIIGVFFLCRFIIFPNILQTTSRLGDIDSTVGGLRNSFFESLLNIFNRALLDLIYSTLQVWLNTIFNFSDFSFQHRIAWFVFGLGVLLTTTFSVFHETTEQEVLDNSSPFPLFLVGFAFFVLSALPIWAIGKEVSTGGWNDRFALAPMLGASLMIIALLLWFVHPARQKLVLSFLLIFSIATQAWVVNDYRRDWSTQLNYYWQLYWRVPAMQTGTALFSFELPSTFISHDTDATYAINVLYHFQTKDGSIPHWFITPENQLYFQPNKDFKNQKRNLEFNGNTSDGISVLHQTDDSCLRVLDTVYQYDPLLDDGQDVLIPLSNLSRIIPDPEPVLPDMDIFGSEPDHTWCYFFEKADLARQTGDWNKVITLYDEAQKLGFSPGYGAEYIPFIEAFAQTGDWEKAYELTISASEETPRHKRLLCMNWVRLSSLPLSDKTWVEKVDQSLSC